MNREHTPQTGVIFDFFTAKI